MLRWIRRFVWLGLIGGVGAAAYTVWQRRQLERPAPEWSSAGPAPLHLVGDDPHRSAATFDPPSGDPSPNDAPIVSPPPTDTPPAPDPALSTWVAPVDGACPAGYPVKGNHNSRIYHVPGGRFYDRTVVERCYATAADAEADGYRAAKS
jgi:hypothetical protein